MIFKVGTIQNLLIAAKQKKAGDSIITDLHGRVSLLTDKINAYEIIAKEFLGKDSLAKDIQVLFASKVSTMKEQRAILEQTIADFKKEIKRWKRKVRWTAVSGIVATAAVAYLYISK